MTHPKLRKEESDVLKNLLSGMSTSAVARKLGLHRSKVKNIIDRLVYYGLIRAVPGTKNPVIYEDPYNVIPFPLRGGTPKETDHTPPVSESTAPPDNSSHGYKVDMSLVKETGISTDKECPPDYVETHMTGCIRMQIVSIGRFDTLRDPAGFTIGYWNDPKPIRGNTVYGGEIRIFNQSITWQYREGNKGSRTFMLYPSRIYLDPKQFKTEEEAKDVFIDRANFVASLFAAQGWKLVNPQIRGHFEYAIRDHPGCRWIELYRYVARNDRMPVKLGILMDMGVVEDLSEEYHISTLRLTPVGEKVAEHLQAIADLLDNQSS